MILFFQELFEAAARRKERVLQRFLSIPFVDRMFAYITPNDLCYFRMFAAPVLLFLFLGKQYSWAFIVFIVAVLTDFIDGPLARKNEQVTEEGKTLDPMADKMLITVPLLIAGYQHYNKMAFTFFLATALLLIFTSKALKPYLREKFDIPLSTGANGFGQWKMVLESITLGILLYDPENALLITITEYMLWGCIALGIVSFLRHLARFDYKMENPKKRIITIPNIITLAALFACIPAGFALARSQFTSAFILLVGIFLSDWVDGFLARKLKQETYFGAALDPIRDYTVRFLALAWFLLQAHDVLVTSLGFITVGLEVVVAIVNVLTAARCKTTQLANMWGKVRGTIHYIAFGALLAPYANLFTLPPAAIRILFSCAAVASLLALLSYVDQRRQLIISANRTTGQDY